MRGLVLIAVLAALSSSALADPVLNLFPAPAETPGLLAPAPPGLQGPAMGPAPGLLKPSEPVSPYAPSSQPSKAAEVFKPAVFGKIVVRLPVGDPFAVYQTGPTCTVARTLTWPGGQKDFTLAAATDTFREEFVRAGLQVEGDANNLFEPAAGSAADFVASGIAVEFRVHVCTPNVAQPTMQTGDIHMTVDWQLYSRLQKQVLATVRTSATETIETPQSGGSDVMAAKVFGDLVRQLANAPEIRSVLSGRPRAEGELVKPAPQPRLGLSGALQAIPHGVDLEADSVVLVRVGGGHGSGFLVSNDGYILTAAHVVGDAVDVKIRWPDRAESDGQVVRVSRGRDVALIKTEVRGARRPLPIRLDTLLPGETVLAVGAPLDQELQGSITRGVVSGNRVLQGYAFVQSDVNVGPGVSGGPLLDDHGRVVGITVLGMRINGAPQGINLFVPIKDALDFLALDLR